MKLFFETSLNLPFENVKDGFGQELFLSLSPQFIPSRLKVFEGCKVGNEVHIEIGPALFSQLWISVITFEETNAMGWSFIDEGRKLPWPLKKWKHHHRVDKVTQGSCKIIDDIEYSCSSTFLEWAIKPFLWLVFSIRPKRYKKFFKDLA